MINCSGEEIPTRLGREMARDSGNNKREEEETVGLQTQSSDANNRENGSDLKSTAAVPANPTLLSEIRWLLSNAWSIGLVYAVGFVQNLISASIVGHLGADALAASALATMYANATGYAVLYGTASAIDTLVSQAYGASNLKRIGAIRVRGTAVLLALSIPIAVLWLCLRPILIACGQHPDLVEKAAVFIRFLLVGCPAVMAYEAHKKTLQAVGDMTPPLVIAGIATCVNATLGGFLVHHTSLGLMGSAISNSVAQWTMLGCALTYFRWHRSIRSAVLQCRSLLLCRRAAYTPAAAWSTSDGLPAESAPATGPSREVNADLPGDEDKPGGDSPAPQANTESDSPLDTPVQTGAAAVAVAALQSDEEKEEAGLLPAPHHDGAAKAKDSPPSLQAAEEGAAAQAVSIDNSSSSDGETMTLASKEIDDVLDAIATPFELKAAFSGWPEFLSLGMPSAAMLIAEWSSYEVASLIAGLYSTDTLAAHNIISTTAGLLFMVVLGVSVSGSLRVGNYLGAHKPAEAKLAYRAVLCCTVGVMAVNSGFALSVRNVWPRFFTDDTPVVDLVSLWLPLLALYSVFDAGQGTSSGVLKGVGRPALAAYTNVVSYCIISLPLCYYFCITLQYGLPGIWAGFVCGVLASFVFLTTMLHCLNWQKEADVAHARASQK